MKKYGFAYLIPYEHADVQFVSSDDKQELIDLARDLAHIWRTRGTVEITWYTRDAMIAQKERSVAPPPKNDEVMEAMKVLRRSIGLSE